MENKPIVDQGCFLSQRVVTDLRLTDNGHRQRGDGLTPGVRGHSGVGQGAGVYDCSIV